MKKNRPTPTEIAMDWELWGKYVDPAAAITRTRFDRLSIPAKIVIQQLVRTFFDEPTD